MKSLFLRRHCVLVGLFLLSTQAVDVLAQQSPPRQTRVPELETPQTQTVTGIVKNFTQAPTGDVDGFELDNGADDDQSHDGSDAGSG